LITNNNRFINQSIEFHSGDMSYRASFVDTATLHQVLNLRLFKNNLLDISIFSVI